MGDEEQSPSLTISSSDFCFTVFFTTFLGAVSLVVVDFLAEGEEDEEESEVGRSFFTTAVPFFNCTFTTGIDFSAGLDGVFLAEGDEELDFFEEVEGEEDALVATFTFFSVELTFFEDGVGEDEEDGEDETGEECPAATEGDFFATETVLVAGDPVEEGLLEGDPVEGGLLEGDLLEGDFWLLCSGDFFTVFFAGLF